MSEPCTPHESEDLPACRQFRYPAYPVTYDEAYCTETGGAEGLDIAVPASHRLHTAPSPGTKKRDNYSNAHEEKQDAEVMQEEQQEELPQAKPRKLPAW